MPRMLLHVEGFFVLVASLYFFWFLDFSWLLFLILFLAPDLSMIGYAVNNRTGAISYNLFHTYFLPLILLMIGHVSQAPMCTAISIIWFAHIGMDRMLGYGLKYATAFKDTHMQKC
ncbi:DUF4260 domain-containing protein [Brevibacillus migulae]|uniref:DUF4260 domain-containing protein n=1 Tax=Brevibacillus migulae TaxID=1644114 RepID=UPI00106EC992|nr:DUF4260 domain-containing protein [Brevibacillus migulae]